MPEMDGYEATALIRARHSATQLPVIAMTAHAVAGFRENSLAMGMNDYVTKPIEPERLFAVLAAWIGNRAALPGLPPQPVEPAGQGGDAAPAAIDTAIDITSDAAIDTTAALARLGGNHHLLTVLLDKFVEEFAATPAQTTEILKGETSPPTNLNDAALKKAKVSLAMARAQLNKSLKAFGHPPTASQQAQLVSLQQQFEWAERALARLEATEILIPAPATNTAELKRAKIQLAMRRADLKKAITQEVSSPQLGLLEEAVRQAESTLTALDPDKNH